MQVSGCSTNGLLMMHAAIADALVIDDNTPAGQEKTYGVRDFVDWRTFSDAIESELTARDTVFVPISW